MSEETEKLGIMPESTINEALDAARARISRAERDRAELDRSIAAAREEERLLLRLLALRRGTVIEVGPDPTGPGPRDFGFEHRPEPKQPVVEAAFEELVAAGRSLHISELMRLLRERTVRIPGAGTQANLITHLRRDPRFVRPSRGMYGLGSWGLQNMPRGRRKRRRKRVRVMASDRGSDT